MSSSTSPPINVPKVTRTNVSQSRLVHMMIEGLPNCDQRYHQCNRRYRVSCEEYCYHSTTWYLVVDQSCRRCLPLGAENPKLRVMSSVRDPPEQPGAGDFGGSSRAGAINVINMLRRASVGNCAERCSANH